MNIDVIAVVTYKQNKQKFSQLGTTENHKCCASTVCAMVTV